MSVKTVNLALQGGGSHGAYTWGALDALAEDERIEISAISGASAGAMNAVVFASGMGEGGGAGARAALEKFWLSVSSEGSLAPFQRRWVDKALEAWGAFWPGPRWIDAWTETAIGLLSPYEFNPFNVNPLRAHLEAVVDFERLRAGADPKLFIAATNVRTGRGEIFRRDILTVDHAMASACLPQLFQAVIINGQPYWDGGFAGNPPLWPLFYETQCRDAIIVQINPIERDETPRLPGEIADRVDEITFNASLLAELRATDFVGRLIRSGVLKSDEYREERLHRIGGAGKLESFDAASKNDVSWPFLQQLRDLGRSDTKAWLEENFDSIGVKSTLDMDKALQREPVKPPTKGAAATS
ncbi:MAG TPA: patatin-like phospholipase family protein [Roseiarcus sp.]|nr:patatin-like phospholipase family protein [Roseiarcus sp.]